MLIRGQNFNVLHCRFKISTQLKHLLAFSLQSLLNIVFVICNTAINGAMFLLIHYSIIMLNAKEESTFLCKRLFLSDRA